MAGSTIVIVWENFPKSDLNPNPANLTNEPATYRPRSPPTSPSRSFRTWRASSWCTAATPTSGRPPSRRDELYKNRSSRKTDSQSEKSSSGSPILLKIVSENRSSWKTYFYTIASSSSSTAASSSPPCRQSSRPSSTSHQSHFIRSCFCISMYRVVHLVEDSLSALRPWVGLTWIWMFHHVA